MNENWKFSDIPYTRPDVEALQARYDALTRRARDAAGPEELLQVVRDRDALQQEVSLCQSIATIRAFHDVTDAFYQTEFQETLPRLETLDSQSLAQAIVESPYAQAVDTGTTVYCSGQLGLDPATGALAEGVQAQTHQALKNLQAVLGEAGLTLDSVVKTTVFVQDLGDFGAVNEVYGSYFHGGFPARSCVQIAALPKNALVEIECIAVR